MNARRLIIKVMLLVVLGLLSAGVASGSFRAEAEREDSQRDPGQTLNQTAGPPTRQIIIKFKATAADEALAAGDGEAVLARLSQTAGEELTYVRPMSGDAHVLSVAEARRPAEMAKLTASLDALPEVEYAEPDLIRGIDPDIINAAPAALPAPAAAVDVTPNDTFYGNQWHYGYTAGTSEGLNLPPAWAITTGITDTVVAVIDTGILNHPDLAGRTVPGYDMISDPTMANDGGGRDADPSDPGDWVGENECYPGHGARNSSWHGTHVAGTIGAASNNSLGVAGVNWQAKILPVRVLGKCGGITSDIVDAVRWAAGISIGGVPDNANPADVINLSLGGLGDCETSEQNAFNDVVAAGVTVIIAAGNSNADAAGFSPGNCNNVITVAATDRGGDKAYYSNYGNIVEVSAPGGETTEASNGILSTLNDGDKAPGNHNYVYYQGTSMAAPHVAGLASLILAERPAFNQADVLWVLQHTARSFPAGSSCNTSICGAGIVDAYASLTDIDPPVLDEHVFLPHVTTPPPPPPVPNGDFEQGPTIWTEYSYKEWPLIVPTEYFLEPVSPRNGNWAVWLGGDHDEVAYIEQSLQIPPWAPYFTYWHWIGSDDQCGYDVAEIIINGAVLADAYDLCADENTGGWVKYSVNLSAWSGQTVDVRIQVVTDEVLVSSLYVDDVSFASSPAPPANEGAAEGPAVAPAATRRQ